MDSARLTCGHPSSHPTFGQLSPKREYLTTTDLHETVPHLRKRGEALSFSPAGYGYPRLMAAGCAQYAPKLVGVVIVNAELWCPR